MVPIILSLLLAHLFTGPITQSQGMLAIYDGRILLDPTLPESTKLTTTESALVKRAAKRTWGEQKDCESDVEIADVVKGAFTRPQSNQKAVLCTYCRRGNNFTLNGVIIIENNKIVAHVKYKGAGEFELRSLPDINGNGLSEILIAGGDTGQGYSNDVISIIELSTSGVKKFGLIDTYEDSCGTADRQKITAYKIYVKTGTTPVFYRETFKKKDCKGNRNWLKSKALKQISPEADSIEYRRIK